MLELALGRSLLADHRRACEPGVRPIAGRRPRRAARPRFVAKLIVFAAAAVPLPGDRSTGPSPRTTRSRVPRLGDVPDPGTRFEAGEPGADRLRRGRDAAEALPRSGRSGRGGPGGGRGGSRRHVGLKGS